MSRPTPAAPDRPTVSLAELRATLGQRTTHSEWIIIDQPMIDAFAHLTGDHNPLHVDTGYARATRFGGTIAHGLLVLSLLPRMLQTASPLIREVRMGVNYGYDRVRFVAPVPVGSRIRGRVCLVDIVEDRPGFIQLVTDVTVELDGAERPAMVCRARQGRWIDETGG